MKVVGMFIGLCVLGLCHAAPKIESGSAWENLLQVGGDVEITRTASSGRSSDVSFTDFIENYVKSHDVSFKIPFVGSTVTLGGRNLDNEELSFKLKFDSGSQVQARKKSKIKKIFVPILAFILLKAMTLIPLALGVLGLKTWNAIQLSFVSFVTTLAMAVWKLCSKVNGDHPPPQIIHETYDPHHHIAAARADQIEGVQMAYNAYAPPQY
ncbi:hypothetical protein GWI33_007059 [Rhynchophorus ferrugineus]|uniref:Osiris 19 n=1 Tax=Rhynchophorus ferrugineus TaxID=354439 RepID=A0A834MGW6_RHYFE|nr:hypothetical protein GWI33_007059 [Rhynchophorus ferrugineus]